MRAIISLLAALLPSLALAGPPDLTNLSVNNGLSLETFNAARPHNVIINDKTGRAIFTIDMDKRTITVPSDVEVNATARAVIDAMEPYLRAARGAK